MVGIKLDPPEIQVDPLQVPPAGSAVSVSLGLPLQREILADGDKIEIGVLLATANVSLIELTPHAFETFAAT